MAYEDILLIISFVLVAADILLFTRFRSRTKPSVGLILSSSAFVLFIAYYGLFVRAFLVNDFSIQQVYQFSSSSLPWALRLFASWGGSSGSLLLITLMIGVVYVAYRFYSRGQEGRHQAAVSKMLGVLLIYFVTLTLLKGPFQRYETVSPDGMGLNPQLQSIWMLYHPLVVFAGYAFVVLAFALMVASMETGRQHDGLLDFSLRSAWLLFTVGIALGGLWAYQVLGWGGYWAWDPVETASLIPWLALTAYFHGAKAGSGKDVFPEFMIVLSFDSLLFLSALTRGGFLNSVHAYAFSPAGPALITCAVVATAYFLYLRNRLRKPFIAWRERSDSTQKKLMLASQLSLLGLLWVCFTGVAVPAVQNLLTGSANATGFDFYNYVSFPFVAVFVAASLLCESHGSSMRIGLATLGVASAAALAFVFMGFPTTALIANLGLPLIGAALLLALVRFVESLAKTRSLRPVSRQLIHLGVLVVLLGVFVSSSTGSEAPLVGVQASSTGSAVGIDVGVGRPEMVFGSGQVYFPQTNMLVPEASTMNVDVEVSYAGRTYAARLVGQFYPNYGLVAHPVVVGDGLTDIYIHLTLDQVSYDALYSALINENAPPATVSLQVAVKPLVNLIWLGSALMSLGIALSALSAIRRSPASQSMK